MCAQIYLFDNGLCRLCTTKYEAPTKDNLKKARLHLTNFAVNKTSKNFVAGEHGTKRSLKAVLAQLVRPPASPDTHKGFRTLPSPFPPRSLPHLARAAPARNEDCSNDGRARMTLRRARATPTRCGATRWRWW